MIMTRNQTSNSFKVKTDPHPLKSIISKTKTRASTLRDLIVKNVYGNAITKLIKKNMMW